MTINEAMAKVVALYGATQLVSNGADEPFEAASWDGGDDDGRYAVTYQGVCEINYDGTLNTIPAYRFVPNKSSEDAGSGITYC